MRMLALVLAVGLTASTAQTKPADQVPVVAVAGCLRETAPNTWSLVNAGEPVPSTANAATPKELEAIAKSGKNEFRLIGVSEFKLPAHRDHIVLVKGLHIKAAPVSRLNITSLTMLAASCAPK